MIAAVAIFVSDGLGIVAAGAHDAAAAIFAVSAPARTATAVSAHYSAMTSHLYLMPRKNVWEIIYL